eukprot:COSAG02_NODE_22994_length_733_cov_0.859621_2_plen_58_part_01
MPCSTLAAELSATVGDQALDRFRLEYRRLQAALKSSQASEERLIKKCKALSSEMVEKV